MPEDAPPEKRAAVRVRRARLDREVGRDSRIVQQSVVPQLHTLGAGGPEGDVGDEHWFATLKFLTVWGYYTSRVGMTEELRTNVMPGRSDGDGGADSRGRRYDGPDACGRGRSGRGDRRR